VKTTRLAMVGLILATLVTACSNSDAADTPPPFCDVAFAVKSAADAQQKLFDAVDPPPATAVQIAVDDFAAKFAAMNSVAPTGIKSDVATLNGVAQQLANVVRTSNYDVVAMVGTPEFAALTTTFSSATYTSAQDRFQRYLDTNCGFTTTPGT
jgi:hypothetical protein